MVPQWLHLIFVSFAIGFLFLPVVVGCGEFAHAVCVAKAGAGVVYVLRVFGERSLDGSAVVTRQRCLSLRRRTSRARFRLGVCRS